MSNAEPDAPRIDSLDDMLCFSLYAAARAVTQAYRAVLLEKDLTYPQFLVLLSLTHSPELTVTDLGRAMHLDSGTLSPLLRRLGERGLLTRARGHDDERVVFLSITASGRQVLSDIGADVDCLSAAYGLRSDEVGGLLSTLHRITDNMNELTASRRALATA